MHVPDLRALAPGPVPRFEPGQIHHERPGLAGTMVLRPPWVIRRAVPARFTLLRFDRGKGTGRVGMSSTVVVAGWSRRLT
ncbi:hypothetical protein GCM10010844_32130 [Deinococcus radiotolerans]|uniref:Uncharacterized protein n=1 Tax=Deinococcus radiotolerans TaxID=1309407 RepID=A0ABQ2FNC9_9DEIO|nr:hypothetical protein GCM10010844_32130 [Deinococcus radiotolerans]